jgi:hypothetical protein
MASPTLRQEVLYAAPTTVAEQRRRVQEAELERAAVRAIELAEQASPMKDAEERIRIWERLHVLPLPRTSSHVLVRVIATQTCLSVDQVQEEQRRRATAAAAIQPSRSS